MKKKYIAAVVLGAALNFTTFAQSFDSSPQPENVAVANLPRARENFPGINRPSIELTVTHEASGANTPPDTHDLGGSTAPGLIAQFPELRVRRNSRNRRQGTIPFRTPITTHSSIVRALEAFLVFRR